MSDRTPIASPVSPPPAQAPHWRVRAAAAGDAPVIAAGVRELLLELGANPAPAATIEATALTLIEDHATAAMLVAESGAESSAGIGAESGAEGSAERGVESGEGIGAGIGVELVGLLGASWQPALHIPGRYGLIQDLWVHPSWRGHSIGGDLLAALFELARELGIVHIEVGLPRERFAGLARTEAFYRDNGFALLGARMRRISS